MGGADVGGPAVCAVVDGICSGLGHFGVEVVKIGGWMRWMEADGGVDGRLIMVGVGGVVHAVWDGPVVGEAEGQEGVAADGPVGVMRDGAGDGAGGKVGMYGWWRLWWRYRCWRGTRYCGSCGGCACSCACGCCHP